MRKPYQTSSINFIAKLSLLFIACTLMLNGRVYAQTPSVSYGGGTYTFTAGTPVNLTPTSTNVSPQGYSNSIDSISTIQYLNGASFAVDNKGSIYYTFSGNIYRVAPTGGTHALISRNPNNYNTSKDVALDSAGIFM